MWILWKLSFVNVNFKSWAELCEVNFMRAECSLRMWIYKSWALQMWINLWKYSIANVHFMKADLCECEFCECEFHESWVLVANVNLRELSFANVNLWELSFANVNFMRAKLCEFYESWALRLWILWEQSWALQMWILRELSIVNVNFMTAEHCKCEFIIESWALKM